jgi:FkbM family methyltransferase
MARRSHWWQQRKDKGHIDVRIWSNVRMRLYFEDELSRLIYCQDFERQEREFLTAFLSRGDVFIDVGANIGLFSLIASKSVGRTGCVYAFEPCSTAFRRLQASVDLNHFANVRCFPVALSDSAGPFVMNVSLDGFDAWNSLARPAAGNSFGTEMVTSVTWDEFAREHDLIGKVAMMKIDVEGWESRVLRGGAYCLSRDDAPILQVEFTDVAALSAGSNCTELYRTLETFGYQMFTYDAKGRQLLPEPLRAAYPYQNLLAVKMPEAVATRLARRTWLRWGPPRSRFQSKAGGS